MSANFDKGIFGDSARNKLDVILNGSNHVFDGAGENIQQYCECGDDRKSDRNSVKRYINPAICVERVESSRSVTSLHTDSSIDVTPHPHTTYRSSSTPYLCSEHSRHSSGSVKRITCRLDCEEGGDDDTPRLDRTYREDGPDTFRLSVASLSTSATAKEDRERIKQRGQEAFEQWLTRKKQEVKIYFQL